MNKKIIVGYVVSAILISVLVYAGFVGQLHSVTGTLKCPNVVIDTNNADGRMMLTYFSYQLTDSTGKLRQEATTMVNQNPYNYNVDFAPDISGTWWLKTQLLNKRFYKNKVNYFGVCASQSKPISVSKVVNVCGNGLLESDVNTYTSPEQCDDGNIVDSDGCNNVCKTEFCGDGIQQSGLGEVCDNAYSCSEDCQTIFTAEAPINYDFVPDIELNQNLNGLQFVIQDSYVLHALLDSPFDSKNFGKESNTLVEKSMYVKSRTYYTLNLSQIISYPSLSVQQAILNISTDGHDNNPLIGVYKFDSNWQEYIVNWNNQPCGLDFSACVSNSRVIPSQVKNGVKWTWSINITSLVNEALSNGDNELNLAFKFVNERDDKFDLDMRSREENRCNYGDFLSGDICRGTQTLSIKI